MLDHSSLGGISGVLALRNSYEKNESVNFVHELYTEITGLKPALSYFEIRLRLESSLLRLAIYRQPIISIRLIIGIIRIIDICQTVISQISIIPAQFTIYCKL